MSDEPTRDEAIREALKDGIAGAFNSNGRMATRWYVVIEEEDPDSGTALWTLSSDGLAMWDRLGLLDYAHHYEASTLARGWGDSRDREDD